VLRKREATRLQQEVAEALADLWNREASFRLGRGGLAFPGRVVVSALWTGPAWLVTGTEHWQGSKEYVLKGKGFPCFLVEVDLEQHDQATVGHWPPLWLRHSCQAEVAFFGGVQVLAEE